ncbi:MAG: hypothetical protein ACTSQ8_08000 [Candidatus Helarchaeota archaeon]
MSEEYIESIAEIVYNNMRAKSSPEFYGLPKKIQDEYRECAKEVINKTSKFMEDLASFLLDLNDLIMTFSEMILSNVEKIIPKEKGGGDEK